MTEERIRFIVKFEGHWAKRGWTHHEREFVSAEDAWRFYQSAAAPKEVDVVFDNGFRAGLSDRSLERYFKGFMQD